MKHTHKMLTEQLAYMYSLERFGIKFGLQTMTALLAELGNPHLQFPSVHITGTNGKGSTAAMLESVVRAAGYTTALYTSPHLFAFNERIKVGGGAIADEDLARLIEGVRTAAERAKVSPTFFEFTTAVAFCYFAQKKPDLAIVEVGMGGLLDATNVITPRVSVITTIGLDHQFLLGETKEEIAANKAGIIKQGIPVVTGVRDPGVLDYFSSVCRERGAALHIGSRDIAIEALEHNRRGQAFAATLPDGRREAYRLPLLGRHQLDNAAVVLLVLEELRRQGMKIEKSAIQHGLAATVWPGRLELVSEKPFILVDGAHNAQSLLALAEFLTAPATKPPSYEVLVVGMKNDKDVAPVRDTLAPLFTHVIATEGAYEPMPAEALAAALHHSSVEIVTDPRAAAERGLAHSGAHGTLVVTGSLYMIPPALSYLREQALAPRTAESLSAAL